MRHTHSVDGFLAATVAAIVGLLWLVLGVGAAADAVAAGAITVYCSVDDVRRGLFIFFFHYCITITNGCLHAPTAPITS